MTAQLELIDRPVTTIPLREALNLVAQQWTMRLGVEVRVVEVPHVGCGAYRIEHA